MAKAPRQGQRLRRGSGLAVASLGAAGLWAALDRESLLQATGAVLSGYAEIAWVVALGVLLAAGLRASGLDGAIGRRLSTQPVRAVVLASLVGGVTPICGLTVMPLIAGLLAGGVGLAPVMAFWVAAPVTDPAIFAATAGMLGPAFAIYMLLASITIGMAAGFVTQSLARCGWLDGQLRPRVVAAKSCTASAPFEPGWRIWRDASRRRVFAQELLAALRLIGLWLTLAFVGEYWIARLVPAKLVAAYAGADNPLAVPAAVALGAPIYVEAYAALPLLRGFLDMGLAPGAAMAFLIAGGVISAFSAVAVIALVRWRVFALYLGSAIIGAIAAGYGFDIVLGGMT